MDTTAKFILVRDITQFLCCDDVKRIVKEFFQIARAIDEFFRGRFDLLIQEIDSIQVERLKSEQRECKKAARNLKLKATTFQSRFRSLSRHINLDNDEAESVKESCRRGNARRLSAYIDTFKTHMERCKASYNSFVEVYNDVVSRCNKLQEECYDKQRLANSAKIGFGVAGGGITGAAAVAFVASSVSAGALAAGVFLSPVTFGLGMVAGFAVAAGGAAVSAVATGVGTAATVKVTRELAKRERGFKGICDDLEKMRRSSLDDLDDKVNTGYNVVENLEPEVEDFEKKVEMLLEGAESVQDENHLQQMKDVCRAFDSFLEQVQEALSSQ